ncbi:MAG: AtpZ/AtpI family protein [Flavobacteriales bacterium]|nr:AtpZ/AtpI family protein [Flavobacteriales bacterium]
MKSPKKRPLNQFLKYSNLALQMGVTIGLGAFLGMQLDKLVNKDPLFTIIFSLLAVFGALYKIIKEVTRLNK